MYENEEVEEPDSYVLQLLPSYGTTLDDTRRGPGQQTNESQLFVGFDWHVEIQFNLFLKSLDTRAAQGQQFDGDKDVPVLHK